MKNKIIKSSIAIFSALAFATSAYAVEGVIDTNVNVNATAGGVDTNLKVNADVKITARIEKGKERASQEIDRRIKALNELSIRISGLVRVSSDEKTKISTSITDQINLLTSLKTKISADTDIAILKTDIQSITKSYRVFILIMPQARITAAVDVINNTIDIMSALQAKLQTRVTTAQNAGKDVSSLSTLLAEISVKLADAKVQTTAAIGHIINLKPDNGDQAVMKSNNDAFAQARADIKVARADLETGRLDARKIINGLKTMKVDVTATTTP